MKRIDAYKFIEHTSSPMVMGTNELAGPMLSCRSYGIQPYKETIKYVQLENDWEEEKERA